MDIMERMKMTVLEKKTTHSGFNKKLAWTFLFVILIAGMTGYVVNADIPVPPTTYSPEWLTPGIQITYDVILDTRANNSFDFNKTHQVLTIALDLITPTSIYYSTMKSSADDKNSTPQYDTGVFEYGKVANPVFYVDPRVPFESLLSPDGREYTVINSTYSSMIPRQYNEAVIRIETKPDPANDTYSVVFGEQTGLVYEFFAYSADNNQIISMTHRPDLTEKF